MAAAATPVQPRHPLAHLFAQMEDFVEQVPLVLDAQEAHSWELLGAELLGAEADPAVADAARRLVNVAQGDRLSSPPRMRLVTATEDAWNLMPTDPQIIGVVGDDSVFPLASKLYRQAGGDDAKYVRVDGVESYQRFRQEMSAEMVALRAQVRALDEALRTHMRDPRAHSVHGIDPAFGADPDFSGVDGPQRVPLSLPSWCKGKVECWRDGGAVCVSVALPGSDGETQVCTAAMPVARHAREVVGYAHQVGSDVPTLIGVLPTVACMMAGRELVPQVAAAVPYILAHPQVRRMRGDDEVIGKLVPTTHPVLAALIALLQRCQRGDPQACAEWKLLADASDAAPNLRQLLAEARDRLAQAQERA